MDIFVPGDDVKEYEKLKIISQITPIKEKIRYFEKKYGCALEDMEKKFEDSKEDFAQWDDYIEWKAYFESLKDLEKRLKEVENAKDIRIT